MNDTEQLFVAAAVWALIAAVIARFIPNWPGRIAFFALAIGIPFWELPYGYFNFQRLCREEGSLRVFEPIAAQREICADYPYETAALAMLKIGFVTVEARDKNGSVRKYSKGSSGDIEKVTIERVSSEYCVTNAFVRGLPWRTMRNEIVIVRERDRQVVARNSDFVWFGMWWQEATVPILGRGGECRHDGIGAITNALIRGVT
jgi:hypothetical protein